MQKKNVLVSATANRNLPIATNQSSAYRTNASTNYLTTWSTAIREKQKNSSLSQEIPSTFLEPESSLQSSAQAVTCTYLRQMNPADALLTNFRKAHFSISLPSMTSSSRGFLPPSCPTKIPHALLLLPHTCHSPRTTHPPRLVRPSNIWPGELDTGSNPGGGKKVSLFQKMPRPTLGLIQPPVQFWVISLD